MRREKFSGENEKNTCVLGTSMVFYNGVKRAVLCRRRSESVTGAAKWRHEHLYFRRNYPWILSKALNEKQLQAEKPQVNVGDTVKVHVKVKEGSRERIQVFEGTVIAKKHGGIEETITVRRLSYGVGVEKVFPVHSPSIEKIETVRSGFVRRAKLYYLRDRVGKAAKVREKL